MLHNKVKHHVLLRYQLILLDIYPASEKPIEGITSARLVQDIQARTKASVIQLNNREQAKAFIVSWAQDGDVILTLGAGDVSKLGPELLSED